MELAKAMENEDGVEGAVRAFLKHLPIQNPDTKPPTKPSKAPKKQMSARPPKHSSSFSISGCFGCSPVTG